MTRQGRSPGFKPRVTGGGSMGSSSDTLRVPAVGAPVGPDGMAATRVKAAWYLVRTGNADLDVLGALGLACEQCGRPRPGEVCQGCLREPGGAR